LLLIVVWCLGSMAMRITDLAVAVSLDYPYSRYDSVVLAAFDVATAVLAIWLRIKLRSGSSARLITSLSGLVAALTIRASSSALCLRRGFRNRQMPCKNPVYGKRSRPADHQHLRRNAVGAGPVHPRGGDHHRHFAVGACGAVPRASVRFRGR